MSIFYIDEVEKIIGYEFKDKMLLRQCFTHSSYANEHGEKENNELLEFFGDSIIQYVVTEHLYKFYEGDEGKLTSIRQKIVSKEPLLRCVMKLGLNKYMLLGKGQEKSNKNDEKLLSSVYEAICAGIYLDGGMQAVKKFITQTIISDYVKKEKTAQKKETENYKGTLQEYVQKRKLGSISYKTLSRTGPDHSPKFKVAVLLNGKDVAESEGPSKKAAENSCAMLALNILQQRGN